eukprot:2199904-Pyramimonas_sp.AAC.1
MVARGPRRAPGSNPRGSSETAQLDAKLFASHLDPHQPIKRIHASRIRASARAHRVSPPAHAEAQPTRADGKREE